ncbi:hypothetical protein [Chryseobacterium oryctis]|uniref:Uncharacterized protein n=1 Tax=Chryseobacterium oryctis TaxID=2952618 RepID=A0ABT3HLP0_9FLAO|nr:hypothetical protein [Chryseobacterium oryctis]MCW3160600.1 hypothetical protein [Chryseobacterium oryctis]
MKSLYIIAFVALSINIYAQQDKKNTETQEAPYYKESKEAEAKMMKEAKEAASQKLPSVQLASDLGLEVKKQETKTQSIPSNSGKLLPNTATLEEIKGTIPNRQATKHTTNSKNIHNNVPGLPNTATLEEIKKTIPKN